MNKAIIFLNGDKSDYSHIKNYIDKNTLIIGCDGGTKKISELGLTPDAVIGDFDSFNKKILKGVKYVEHPSDKDYTDSEAAIKYAAEKGVDQIFLTGLPGSRIDHMLGNIFLLDKPEFNGIAIKIIEGSQEIYLASGKTEIRGRRGETISFMPLLGDVRAKSSTGLKYDLADYDLSMRGNSGISNELTENTARIDLGEAKLLVLHSKG